MAWMADCAVDSTSSMVALWEGLVVVVFMGGLNLFVCC